ncbi:MAG: tyrosine-type recombinase/integrase [bacterium]
MSLLQECPQCRKRFSLKRKRCLCGFTMSKFSGKIYWVSVYVDGTKRRERIGKSKSAAKQREREILKLRTEERFIDKDRAARLSLSDLCKWYLDLPEVKAKDSYDRDKHFIAHLKRLLGEGTKIKDVTPGKMESYQKQRLAEPSPVHPGKNITPCEVNKEVTGLKVIFNRAVRHGKLKANPIAWVKRLPENNIRQRILTSDEFYNLLDASEAHLRPVLMVGYYMGLRRSEIVNLTWPEVDLRKGFIRLPAERTKTDSPRIIPLHPDVKTILESLPRPIHTDRVFLRYGQPFNEIKHSFQAACKKAGIQNFCFHDLRHCALNNLRKAGNDFFQIMTLSGHKTMSCFKRYNIVSEEELSQIKWPERIEKMELWAPL